MSRTGHFPSFLEGLSLRGQGLRPGGSVWHDFPSFLEGLSLRDLGSHRHPQGLGQFPFLFGRAFIEGLHHE